jgi:hypothetical protein
MLLMAERCSKDATYPILADVILKPSFGAA